MSDFSIRKSMEYHVQNAINYCGTASMQMLCAIALKDFADSEKDNFWQQSKLFRHIAGIEYKQLNEDSTMASYPPAMLRT